MLRRSFTLMGTSLLGIGVLLLLLALLSSPAHLTRAAPPPGCRPIVLDITTDTTWSEACYEIMTTTVTVNPGVVLTISPTGAGTTIYFQTGTRLQVEGNLQALGTAERPITFTASNPTDISPCDGQGRWLGILFGSNSTQNRIQYALIEYACTGIAPSGSTTLGDGDRILFNTLRYNGGTGAFNGAIGGDIDYSEISYNTIYSCSQGIALNEGSLNTIAYNTLYDIAGAGVHLKRGGTGGGNNNIIHRNTIYNCGGEGIYAEDSHSNFLTDNEIYNGNAAGVYLDNGSNNRVTGNLIYRTMLSSAKTGGAVTLVSQTTTLLQNNYIYHNGGGSGYQAAVYIERSPEFVIHPIRSNVIYDMLNDAIEFSSVNSSGGLLQYNALCAVPAHELRNNIGDIAVEANHNRWGTPHPNAPSVGTDPLNHNIRGLINPLTTWITLGVDGDTSGLITVTLRDQDGHTLPPALSPDRTPTLPAPQARRLALLSNWGTLSPATVVVDDNGIATTRFQPGPTPPPTRIIITATDFCNEAVTMSLALPDLAITKTALVTQSIVGGVVAYRIEYANQGTATATGLTIRDTLPAGLQWVADTAVPPWTRGTTSPAIVWTLPTLAAGARGSFLVTTTVNTPAACGLALTNAVVISSTLLETRTDNNSSNAAAVTVLCPSIVITKTGATLSKVGDVVTYTYQISNRSVPASAPALELVSILDRGNGWPGLGNLNARATGCQPLATGATCTFQVPYTVAAGVPDPLVNVVTATYRLTAFGQVVTATDSHSVNLFQPAISFTKTGNALGRVGEAVTYTLTLDNNSSNDTPDLQCRITDALLGLNQTITLPWDAAPYVLTRPYVVPPTASDPLRNTANVACTPVGFTNVITATAGHSVNLFQPSIRVDKSGPAEAYPGERINYTFRITNTGSTDSPALVLDAVNDVGVGWSGLGNLTAQARANGCDSLAAGAACVFSVPYTVPANTPQGNRVNTVSVRYHPLGFSNPVTGTDTHSLAITGAVDIVVVKDDNVGPITNTLPTGENRAAFDAWRQSVGLALLTADPDHREFVFSGDLVTYTISVVNVGPLTATNVVLTETLPLYTTYLGYDWTRVSGRTYRLNIGTLAPGEGVVRYFVVRVNESLPAEVNNLDNLVCGQSDQSDRTPADNCNREDTPVLRRPQIEKTFTSEMGVAGRVISFTITYTNPNAVPLSGLRITDTLPADTVWHSDTAASAGWRRIATTPHVVWTLPTLEPGVVGRFVLNVIYNPPVNICDIPLTNTVTLSVLNPDVPYFAARDTERFLIRCPSDLVVIKDDDVGPTTPLAMQKQTVLARVAGRQNDMMAITQHREFVYEGDIITYTIAVENVGPYTATNVILTEILPLYTDYVGHGWRWVSGRTYTMALGTLVPGQGGIYYFVVRAHETIPEGVENLVNYVCGWGREPDYHPGDNCNYEDTPLRRRPLRVSKIAPRCISPGEYFAYNTFYTNTNTTIGFRNVPMTDTLSPYLLYAGTTTTWTCSGRTCRINIPSIPAATYNQPGPALMVRLNPTFTYTASSRIINTIEISGGYRYILTSTVDLGPDLAVVKNDNIGPLPLAQQTAWEEVRAQLGRPATMQSAEPRLYARPGELITYTILYVNSGVGTARNVVITERLPDYTTYVGGGWTYAGGPHYRMVIGTVGPGKGGELTFVVRVNQPFPLGVDRVVNQVTINTTDPECDTSNNMSADDTPIRTRTLLYVANRDSRTIDVFRTTDFAYLTSLRTGEMPFGMVVVDNHLYVANAASALPDTPSQVQVFDLATHRLITEVTTGYGTLFLTALNGYIYGTNHSDGGEGITVIEHATHHVVARLKPNRPQVYDWGFFGITADPTRNLVYATKRYMGAQGIWTITSTLTPPNFGLKYALNTGSHLPYSLIYNPQTDHLYVNFPHANELRVYNPADFTLWRTFPLPPQAPTPDSTDGGKGLAIMGKCVYNANFAAQSVTVIAEGPCSDLSSSFTDIIPQGTIIFNFKLYLPLVMKGGQTYPYVSHFAVGGNPKGLAAGGDIVFVTLPLQDRIAVLNTRTGNVVYTIPAQGKYPHTAVIVYDAPWLQP